jgi:hypothetical protein
VSARFGDGAVVDFLNRHGCSSSMYLMYMMYRAR